MNKLINKQFIKFNIKCFYLANTYDIIYSLDYNQSYL